MSAESPLGDAALAELLSSFAAATGVSAALIGADGRPLAAGDQAPATCLTGGAALPALLDAAHGRPEPVIGRCAAGPWVVAAQAAPAAMGSPLVALCGPVLLDGEPAAEVVPLSCPACAVLADGLPVVSLGRLHALFGHLWRLLLPAPGPAEAPPAPPLPSLRYQALVERLADPVFLLDADGHILYYNAAGERVTGYGDRLVGRHLSVLLGPESASAAAALQQRLRRGGSTEGVLAAELVRADGRRVAVETNLSAFFDEAGRLQGFIGVARDLTERRRAQEAAAPLDEPRQRPQALLDAIPDPIFAKDRDGRFTLINSAAAELLGLPPERVIGRTEAELLGPGASDAAAQTDRLALQDGHTTAAEERHVVRGQGRTLHVVKVPLRDRTGQVEGLCGIARDITELRRAEEKLRASEERYRELVQQASCIVMRIDQTGTITFFNEFAERFFGYAAEEIVGRSAIGSIIPAESADVVQAMVLDEHRFVVNETVNLTRDGRRVVVRWTNRPVRDRDDRVVGVICVGLDVTEQRHTERALEVQNRRLAALVAAAEVIAATLSLDATLEVIAREAASQTDSEVGLVLLAEGTYGTLTPRAATGLPPERFAAARELLASWQVAPALLDSPSTRRPPSGAEEAALRPLLEILGVRSLLHVPIPGAAAAADPTVGRPDATADPAAEKPVGVLVVGDAQLRHFGESEVEVLTGLASLAGAASARARAHEELVASERLMTTVLSAVPVGVALLRDRHAVWVNETLGEMLGYPAEKLGGRSTREAYANGEEWVAMSEAFYEPLREQGHVRLEMQLRRQDGGVIDALIFGEPLIPNDPAAGVVVAVTDITEEKLLRAQTLKAERLRALGEMAGGVAHDLNNVLGAILGRAQLLMLSCRDETLRTALQMIERSALDGAQTVKRIQQFSRAHRDRDFAPTDLAAVVHEAAEATEHRWRDEAQRRGAQIQVTVEVGPIPLVMASASEVREVLANLIINACDAMPAGGAISLRGWEQDGRAVIEVADTGAGMDEETQAQIFEPFFTTKGDLGTGLGLAVSKGIIQRHGGDIAVRSEIGAGTTFTLWLPIAEALPFSRSSEQLAPAAAGGLHILAVDDDPAIRGFMDETLAALGHDATVVGKGADALALLEHARYDVVITDLGMPDITGRRVAEQAARCTPPPYVIMVTGWGEQARADAVQADVILSKPLTLAGLQDALAKVHPPADEEDTLRAG